jgi:two-component system response regulator AtoC
MPDHQVCESRPVDGMIRPRRRIHRDRDTGQTRAEGTIELLVIDDDRRRASDTARWLCAQGYRASAVAEAAAALKRLGRERFDAVVVDDGIPASSGVSLVGAIRKERPDLAIVAMIPQGAACSLPADGRGADALVPLPATDAALSEAVEKALARNRGRREDPGAAAVSAVADIGRELGALVGSDPSIEAIRGIVARVASTRATVLITGESGTGKSLIAREIHRLGNRSTGPFVEVACGALSDQLLESELFGHAAGAFTGAATAYAGRFLQADGGTIFLDEIGTASPAMQVKLLRVLQDRRFEPVGAGLTREVDVRLVLATNENLAERVAAGSFREDLYWRINVVTIHMPALRDRIGDVPRLAARFAREAFRDAGRAFEGFSAEAIERLRAHAWPGNVRELRHAVERAVYLGEGNLIGAKDLQLESAPARSRGRTVPQPPPVVESPPAADSLRRALEEPERRMILEALSRSGGCRREAARVLGINRTSLYRKFKRLGIDPRRIG